jgi:hypothetical protein
MGLLASLLLAAFTPAREGDGDFPTQHGDRPRKKAHPLRGSKQDPSADFVSAVDPGKESKAFALES